MLRTGYGAAEALLRGGAIFRGVARDIAVARTWAQHISTKSAATSQLQYASLSMRVRQAARAGQPKQFSTSSRRPFQSSRSRRSDKTEYEGAKEKAKGKEKEPEPTGFSARMKKLSKEYGWTALGVYLALSVLDFPFCFLLVRTVGTERIGKLVLQCCRSEQRLTSCVSLAHFEHIVISWFEKVIPQNVQDVWHKYRTALKDNKKERTGEVPEENVGWGVEAAEERSKQAGASKYFSDIVPPSVEVWGIYRLWDTYANRLLLRLGHPACSGVRDS